MSLEKYARKELLDAGLFSKESDYEGMIGNAVMELIGVYADQGHSGFSAELTMQIFSKVGRFKPLSQVTNDPKEWMDVSDVSGSEMWQSKRDSTLFSTDGGKTHYSIDDEKRRVITTADSGKGG